NRAVLPLLGFVGVLMGAPARTASAAGPEDKVTPWVMDKTSGGATAEFIVVMARQADLNPARLMPTKGAKGKFVYDTLWSTAQSSQAALLAELKARGIEHRSFYVVNALWVKGNRALVLELAARSDVARIEGNPVIRNILPAPEGPAPDSPNVVEPGI